jgi:hypothetical protein
MARPDRGEVESRVGSRARWRHLLGALGLVAVLATASGCQRPVGIGGEGLLVASSVVYADHLVADAPHHERIGRQALDRIPYDWRTRLPGWEIEFFSSRRGLLGGTLPADKRIEIYVRENHTVAQVAFTIAHELGHAVDITHNDAAGRAEWRAMRGMSADQRWWASDGASDFAVGAGDFAESFAVWLTGDVHLCQSQWGPPTVAQMAYLAAIALR